MKRNSKKMPQNYYNLAGFRSSRSDNSYRKRKIILFLLILFFIATGIGFATYYLEEKYNYNFFKKIHSLPFNPFPGKEEINILLLGVDEGEQLSRTDTLILFRINLKKKIVGLLSIPRDTRVEISGKGWDKINHAYPLGGIELTKETIESFLEVPIDYYVLLNLEGFKKMVELLGGVEIEVEKRMYYVDRAGGLYINLYPGKQVLNPEEAMGYVRFRHDKEGDIGRIRRQQKFLEAVAKMLLKLENIDKIPEMIKESSSLVETDLTLSQMLKLGSYFNKIKLEDIVKSTVPGRPIMIRGISYWEPEVEETKRIVRHLSSGREYVENSQIKIEVLNGSKTAGLAKKVAERLREEGFQITRIAKAPNNDFGETEVVSLKEGQDKIEERLFGILGITKRERENKGLNSRYNSDFIIIVGEDLTE